MGGEEEQSSAGLLKLLKFKHPELAPLFVANLLHLLFSCFITARNYQMKSFDDFSMTSCDRLQEYFSQVCHSF